MDDADLVEQIDRLLSSRSVSWLFGAGVSWAAGIPLMLPLTRRVLTLAAGTPHGVILTTLKAALPADCHIEHVLSHLGDYIALAERSLTKSAFVGGQEISVADLTATHTQTLQWVADTVRWGYLEATGGAVEKIGSYRAPLIKIDEHIDFVRALFLTALAGVSERRRAVRLFTTNYDTLIEDALALEGISYWDGYSGGAVAFRSYKFGGEEPQSGYSAHVVKLHGSIDWHLGEDGRVWRVRDGDAYPIRTGRVLIHPQSTKYVATQRDPFAAQFDLFRRALTSGTGHVLAICGYSFGADHINDEIEASMARAGNDSAIVVFCQEGACFPSRLTAWCSSVWGSHLYVLTEKGIYVGDKGPFLPPPAGAAPRDWWTFAGMTSVIRNGLAELV